MMEKAKAKMTQSSFPELGLAKTKLKREIKTLTALILKTKRKREIVVTRFGENNEVGHFHQEVFRKERESQWADPNEKMDRNQWQSKCFFGQSFMSHHPSSSFKKFWKKQKQEEHLQMIGIHEVLASFREF